MIRVAPPQHWDYVPSRISQTKERKRSLQSEETEKLQEQGATNSFKTRERYQRAIMWDRQQEQGTGPKEAELGGLCGICRLHLGFLSSS